MEELKDLKRRLEEERPASWEQLPDIALYMDQVLSYMDRQVLRFEDDDGLTAAMVNNYTKGGLVPRAEGKKYNQEHLAYLTVICILKRVMSAKDMGVTLEAQLHQQPSVQAGYDRFRNSLSEAMNRIADEMERFPEEEQVADAAVLVFDADGAGQKATISTAGEMLAAGMTVRVARLPEGEDPDSLLRGKGAEAFRECLDNAVSVVAFQIAVARARESNPDSYDAIARTGQAVLELVKKCPGAVMRAGFMQEAATLLRIPVSALEEDLARLNVGTAPKPKAVSRAEPEKPLPVEDAAAPANNPPPALEMALMEFLFGLGADAQIADMLESYAPDALFSHHVTGVFVRAYVREARGDVDAIVNCKNGIPSCEVPVLEEVFLSQNRAARSELEPADNLRKSLCRLWFDAVCRRLKALPTDGDVGLMRRRSGLSMLSRKFKTMPWHVACQSMRVDTLSV